MHVKGVCAWLVLVGVCIAMSHAQVAQAQSFWTDASGMPLQSAAWVCGDASGSVYALGSNCTLWRTSDEGAHWVSSMITFSDGTCSMIVPGPSGTLLAGSNLGGIVRSTDHGETWLATTFSSGAVHRIAVSPQGEVYADSNGVRILKSLDGGATWSAVPTPPITGINHLVAARGLEVWAANSRQLYCSTDAGVTWELRQTFDNLSIDGVAVSPSGVVLVRTGLQAFVTRSTDGGRTFTRVQLPRDNATFTLSALACDPIGRFYLGYGNEMNSVIGGGLYMSFDEGISWNEVMQGMWSDGERKTPIAGVAFRADGSVIIGTNGFGIYFGPTGGPWTQIDHTVPADKLNLWQQGPEIVAHPLCAFEKGVVVAHSPARGVYRTIDYGRTWYQANGGLGNHRVNHFVRSGSMLFAVCDGAGIFRMPSTGPSWTEVTVPLHGRDAIGFSVSRDGRMFVCSPKDSLFVSTNGGGSWIAVSDAPLRRQFVHIVSNQGGSLFAAGSSEAWSSTDGGYTWTSLGVPSAGVPTGLNLNVSDVFIADDDGNVYWSKVWSNLDSIYGTVNMYRVATITWVQNRDVEALAFDVDTTGHVFGARRPVVSFDSGKTWRKCPFGPQPMLGFSVSPDGVMYASGSKGIMRATSLAALDIGIEVSTEVDSLRWDWTKGSYSPIPLHASVHVVNGTTMQLRNVRASLAVSKGSVEIPSTVKLDATLEPGETSAEAMFLVDVPPQTSPGRLQLTFTCSTDEISGVTAGKYVWVPPSPRPAFSGSLTSIPAQRVRWDWATWDYDGVPSAIGAYTVFSVTAKVKVAGGMIPARGAWITLKLPPSIALEPGDSLDKVLSIAPMNWGDSAVVRWLCRARGITRDTTLTITAHVSDDSSLATLDMSLSLKVDAAPARLHPSCWLSSVPADTLRWDPVAQRYKGQLSSDGTHTTFPMQLTLRNTGTFTARDLAMQVQASGGLTLDSIVGALPDSITPANVGIITVRCRALPDTVVRTAQLCITVTGRNTDTVQCCKDIVLERPYTVTSAESAPAPGGIALDAPHPNPFTSGSDIRYSLSTAGTVSLRITDVHGRTVAVLTEGRQEAGAHVLHLDASALPAGMYLCVLRTEAGTHVRRMVRLR